MRRQAYFIRQLSVDDPEWKKGHEFEIQLLDRKLRSIAEAYISDQETQVIINGHIIPTPVIKAVQSRAPGPGDFVDKTGQSLVF